MKILNQSYQAPIGDSEVQNFQNSIAGIVGCYAYVLPRGWHLLVEIDNPQKNSIFRLDCQDENGGGSFAQVKMNTLLKQPDLIATGTIPANVLQASVRKIFDDGTILSSQDACRAADFIRRDPDAPLSRSEHEWLRDTMDFTIFQGAFRCKVTAPSSTSEPTPSSDDSELLELRISFSGAKEWQDAAICLLVLSAIEVCLGYEPQTDSLQEVDFLRFLSDFSKERL